MKKGKKRLQMLFLAADISKLLRNCQILSRLSIEGVRLTNGQSLAT